MAETLRVGVIGCGTMGRVHFEAYARLGDSVDVVALCDLDAERLAAASRRWPGARVSGDYRTLLEPADLDFVSVCTMPDTHCEVTVAALEAGAHVLCEKPFAMDLDQADRMLEAAESAGRRIQVGTNMRHSPEAGVLRELVASGAVGRPVYTRAWTYYTDLPWWHALIVKRVFGGGALAATAIHILDVALWVAGSPDPVAVSGSTHRLFPLKRAETAPSPEARESYDVEDIAAAHIRLSDGGTLILEGTWAHERPQSYYSFEMICERGTLGLQPLSVLLDEGGEIVDRTPSGYAESPRVGASWGDSVYREISRFVAAIQKGGEPSQSPREIRNLQRITDAIYASAATGREVRLDR